jgi:hypothetical protein
MTGDPSEAGKSKHGDYDAREYPLRDTWIARIRQMLGDLDEAISTKSAGLQ